MSTKLIKFDVSDCPPEYRLDEPQDDYYLVYLDSDVDRRPIRSRAEAVQQAWTHRDSIVKDTIARVVAAAKRDGENMCSGWQYAEWLDKLARGEIELP